VVLVDSKYWKGLVGWLRNTLVECGAVSPEDLDIFTVVDTAEEAVRIIRKTVVL
jgi:hypothetical protein